MKKLDRLILRSFLGPLLLTFTLSVLVLLMQFVWKYVDDLVGKGLEFSVIAKLLMYASATFVPMALPIAVLFASIMTMGNFGEKYELVAMKAGGVSVSRAMRPMAIVALLLTGMAFYFANNVMPTAMLRYRMTLYDITRKKPAINIRPGGYFKDLDGYVIRVGGKSRDGRVLQDVVVYDHSHGVGETNVIVAREGVMQASADNRYLQFSLRDGYSYAESSNGNNRTKRPFTTIGFTEQTITFDISSFAYNESGEDIFKGSYQMMNIYQLDTSVQRLEKSLADRFRRYDNDIRNPLRAWKAYSAKKNATQAPRNTPVDLLSKLPPIDLRRAVSGAVSNATSIAADAHLTENLVTADSEYINRHHIEWHRKFTLSVACLLLFLIGAPFGSIVRKGGLGLPLVASVGFFVLYYVVGMICEKAVRESAMGPEGMWVSSLVMLPIGIVLTLQATTDSSFFDGASWGKFFRRLFHRSPRQS